MAVVRTRDVPVLETALPLMTALVASVELSVAEVFVRVRVVVGSPTVTYPAVGPENVADAVTKTTEYTVATSSLAAFLSTTTFASESLFSRVMASRF